MVVTSLLLFAISLVVLVKAADFFTEAAEDVGRYFRLPEFLIGVTIVAMGTSLPELLSSLAAVVQESPEIIVGNVVGSNIANIFVIVGIAAIIGKRIMVSYELIHVDLPFVVGSAFYFVLTTWDGVFTWQEGVLGLLVLAAYLAYTITTEESPAMQKQHKGLLEEKPAPSLWTSIGIMTLSAVFLFAGAHYTIVSVVQLAQRFSIAVELVAVTAVAIGTSLPELVVSLQAARKGKPEIAIGNVVGSNIFNTFMVMGVPALITSITVPASLLAFSIPMMLVATLLFFFIAQDKDITQWEGWLLLVFYIFFLGKVIGFL